MLREFAPIFFNDDVMRFAMRLPPEATKKLQRMDDIAFQLQLAGLLFAMCTIRTLLTGQAQPEGNAEEVPNLVVKSRDLPSLACVTNSLRVSPFSTGLSTTA